MGTGRYRQAHGAAELMEPHAARDVLRVAFLERLPLVEPRCVAALEELFHEQDVVGLVRLAKQVLGPPPVGALGHLVVANFRSGYVLGWEALDPAVGTTIGEGDDEHPARQLHARLDRILEAISLWARSFGLDEIFLRDAAWRTVTGWALFPEQPKAGLSPLGLELQHLFSAVKGQFPMVAAYNPLLETRGQFKKRLNTYATSVEQAVLKLNPHLVRRPKKDLEHIDWFIQFQVLGVSRAEIARRAGRTEDGVRDALREFRKAIGLKCARAGRRR